MQQRCMLSQTFDEKPAQVFVEAFDSPHGARHNTSQSPVQSIECLYQCF
jgi:hypothetical protein